MDNIYLDYNATTPIDPAVAEAMTPYIYKIFGFNGINEETVKKNFSEISMKNIL